MIEKCVCVCVCVLSEGYRRVTIEVDTRHVIMRRLVEKCGFLLEGILRKHHIVRRRNRDTALYSSLNSDWIDTDIRLKRLLNLPLKTPGLKIADIVVVPPSDDGLNTNTNKPNSTDVRDMNKSKPATLKRRK